MKLFKHIFNRWGWKRALPIFYLFLVAILYMLLKLCSLTVPADQRHLDWLSRSPGCGGLEVFISIALNLLYLPGIFLVAPFLRVETGTEVSSGHALVMFASTLIANAFLVFLIGGGIDYLRNRKKVARK